MYLLSAKLCSLRSRLIALDARPRDGEGQFAPQTDGGTDPATMQAAYGQAAKPPSKIQTISALTEAGLAAYGGSTAAQKLGGMLAKRMRKK